jgi:hypothetical protein
MKVKELIGKLKNSDPDATIFIRDAGTDWPLSILSVRNYPDFVELSGNTLNKNIVDNAPTHLFQSIWR